MCCRYNTARSTADALEGDQICDVFRVEAGSSSTLSITLRADIEFVVLDTLMRDQGVLVAFESNHTAMFLQRS